jgi:hypothetical protein
MFNLLAMLIWTIITTQAVIEGDAALAAVGGAVVALNLGLVALRMYER